MPKPCAAEKSPSATKSFTALPAPTSHAAMLAAKPNPAPVVVERSVPSPLAIARGVFGEPPQPATLIVAPVAASTRRTNWLSATNR